uniref:SCP domain-containing protein n=1 Tax=Chloropicon roscoffensis TaxID=1461544 RepID=A0A7S3FS86_9CHLO
MAAPYFFASRALTALALASLLLALPTFGNSKPGLERWIEDFEWTESGWKVNGWEVTQDVECDPNQCVMRTSRCIAKCMDECESLDRSWCDERCRCTRQTRRFTPRRATAPAPSKQRQPPPAPAPPTAASPPPPGLSAMQAEALEAHNGYRRAHGVPELEWSAEVAKSAQAHADRCVFAHSVGSGYGENLAWGHAGIGKAITDWYNEIGLYNFNRPGFSMGTGHFTAMVWKATRRLGCAKGNCPGQNLWVCQYDPPGNMMGAFPQNVPPPL